MSNKQVLVALCLGVVALSFGIPGATGAPGPRHLRIRAVADGARPSSVIGASDFAVSRPLRSLRLDKTQRILDKTWSRHSNEARVERKSENLNIIPHSVPHRSRTGSQVTAHAPLTTSIPVGTGGIVPGEKFQGISKASAPTTEFPPDPNGAVSDDYYVEMVNSVVAVYDTTTGSRVGAIHPLKFFWNTLDPQKSGCPSSNDGDPVVLYDAQSQRWVLSQFSLGHRNMFTGTPTGPFYECIAVSQTSDPGGSYNQYSFKISDHILPDYPKLGVWNDGYYMTTNRFDQRYGTFDGSAISVFDRSRMIAGALHPKMIDWSSSTVRSLRNRYGMLPASNAADSGPPSSKREYVIGSNDDAFGGSSDFLYLYKAVPDWADPKTGSKLEKGDSFAVKPFNSAFCGFSTNCLPQRGTSARLDAIAGGQLMYPFSYRNLTPTVPGAAPYGAYVVNQTVNLGNDRAGVRWYELANDGSGNGPALYRQGTVGDSSKDRWLGSASIDKSGDVALGYSTSSKRVHPSIRVTARDESTGTSRLGTTETVLKRGRGSQTANVGRWGDYSSMSVEPTDGCTFWYTNEFYPHNSRHQWHTSAASFIIPGCGTDSAPVLGPTQDPIAAPPATVHVSDLSARPNPFSPNGDGNNDSSKLGFRVDRRATVKIILYKRSHRLGRIASSTVDAGRYYARWRGQVGSIKLRSGTYRFKVSARANDSRDSAFHRVTIKR